MRTDKIRKYVLPNIPYLFIGWACLKLVRPTVWPLAQTSGKSCWADADHRRGLCGLFAGDQPG